MAGTQWLWEHAVKSGVFEAQQTRIGETGHGSGPCTCRPLTPSHLLPSTRLILSSKMQAVPEGTPNTKSQKRELTNTHSHITVPISHSTVCPDQEMVLPTILISLPTSISVIQTTVHRQVLMQIFQVILDPVKLSILTLYNMKVNKTDPQTTTQLTFTDRMLKGAQAKRYKMCKPTDLSQTIRESSNRGNKEM